MVSAIAIINNSVFMFLIINCFYIRFKYRTWKTEGELPTC
jgi:hypothetical protein